MLAKKRVLYLLIVLLTSCSYGQLTIICDTPSHLKEISAVEYDITRDVFWVIQDSGNSNELIAINRNGEIAHQVVLKDHKNRDWEDLTRDAEGNLYIGDFGNNNKSKKKYKIYKVNESELDKEETHSKLIEFKLPKDAKDQDFESFFLFDQQFYLFSKSDKKTLVYSVPNKKGEHIAKKLFSHEFKGKNNKITSAAISENEKTVVLLTGTKLWKLTNFKGSDFFSGTIQEMEFQHKSQKEGIGFLSKNEVVITDERNGINGGNIYSFKLH